MNKEYKSENQTRKCFVIYKLMYNIINFFYVEASCKQQIQILVF